MTTTLIQDGTAKILSTDLGVEPGAIRQFEFAGQGLGEYALALRLFEPMYDTSIVVKFGDAIYTENLGVLKSENSIFSLPNFEVNLSANDTGDFFWSSIIPPDPGRQGSFGQAFFKITPSGATYEVNQFNRTNTDTSIYSSFGDRYTSDNGQYVIPTIEYDRIGGGNSKTYLSFVDFEVKSISDVQISFPKLTPNEISNFSFTQNTDTTWDLFWYNRIEESWFSAGLDQSFQAEGLEIDLGFKGDFYRSMEPAHTENYTVIPYAFRNPAEDVKGEFIAYDYFAQIILRKDSTSVDISFGFIPLDSISSAKIVGLPNDQFVVSYIKNYGEEQYIWLSLVDSAAGQVINSFPILDVKAMSNPLYDIYSSNDGSIIVAISQDNSSIELFEYFLSDIQNQATNGTIKIVGDARINSILSADTSELTDVQGIIDTSYEFQWLREGVYIADAVSSNYKLTPDDLGSKISVELRYFDAANFAERVVSAQTAEVLLPNILPSGQVFIDGVAKVGSELSANATDLSDPNGIGVLRFQWYRDGEAISGATAQTYVPALVDAGKGLTVIVSYLDGGRILESVGSAATDPVLKSTEENKFTGGEGGDTAALDLALTDAIISLSKDGVVTIVNRNGDGTLNTLTNIKVAQFTDGTMDLNDFLDLTALSSDQFSDLAKVYVAYFNRAPDALGLYYWADKLAEGMLMSEIAGYFSQSTEAKELYSDALGSNSAVNSGGTINISAFITDVYANVLGRTPDQAGFDFWKTNLEVGNLSVATFILSVIGGAVGPDITYLVQKADLGIYFSAIKGMSNVGDAKDVMVLFGDQATSNTDAGKTSADGHFTDASASGSGEFLFELVGIVNNPFAGVI